MEEMRRKLSWEKTTDMRTQSMKILPEIKHLFSHYLREDRHFNLTN